MNTHLHLARLVLEADSALSIGARKGGERDDVILVVDASGLPALPGSAIAGVLRSMARERFGDAFAAEVFGSLGPQGGQRSRVTVSWGVCHGEDDLPLEVVPAELEQPRHHAPMVKRLRNLVDVPIKRDRVALDHRATARPRGKFDRSVVPKGARFTIELRLFGEEASHAQWQQLLGLLGDDGLRVGGATRAGLGRLRVVRANGHSFALANPADADALRRLPARFDRPHVLAPLALPTSGPAQRVKATITLHSEGFLRIGQGDGPLLPVEDDKISLLTQKTEEILVWKDGRGGFVRSRPLVPASSVKGALSDRTAFHAHRYAGRFVDNATGNGWLAGNRKIDDASLFASYDKNRDTEEVRALFGAIAGDVGEQAGRIFIDDAWLPTPDTRGVCRISHNVIDRFTGGVREHLLFTEEVLFKPTIELRLEVRQPEAIGSAARRAFRDALEDLVSGLLPLGASSTRGNGYFFGSIHWSDDGCWINGGQE